MGISKFLGQQRQLGGEPAVESGDNLLQNASTSSTLEVFASFQEKISHGLQHVVRDDELLDERRLCEEFSVDDNVRVLDGAAEKFGEYLQPDEERLQLRVRVDYQLAGWLAYPAENDPALQGPFGLRRFRQRLGGEQFSEQHIARLQSTDVAGAVGEIHRLVGALVHLRGIGLPSSTLDHGELHEIENVDRARRHQGSDDR